MRHRNEPHPRGPCPLPEPTRRALRASVPIKSLIYDPHNNEYLETLQPTPRHPANYRARGARVAHAFTPGSARPAQMLPARPCLPRRSLPPGPAPLLLLPSLGLAFRQHTARRAANRLYSPSRLCLFATHSPTAARRRHFLAVFGHSCILSWRVPLSKGYLRPESPRALTRLRPPPACYR